MELKPKLGVFLITAGWFKDIGLQGSASSLNEEIDAIGKLIVENLSEYVVPIYSGIISSEESAKKAVAKAKDSGVDALLISPLMWSEDILLKTVLKELPGVPFIFCTFMPYKSFKDFISFDEMLKGSGTVGSLQMSGFLKKEGFKYESIVGYYMDKNVYEEIRKHIISISVNRKLRNIKCGVLPFRCDQMTVTYVDEFNLHKLYGIEFKYLELQRVREIAQSFTKNEIQELKSIINKLDFLIEVDDTNLNEAIKYSLALEKIIKSENLKVLAMNDVIDEMHQCFGLRPCLVNPRLSEYGISIAMEADIAAGIAMHILNEFTGDVPFYTEILCADLQDNTFIMGHAGYYDYIGHDPQYPVKIISDPEYKNSDRFTGACMYYKYKPGPITLINSIYDGKKLRWTVIEGQSLEGPPKLEGDCHVYCKIEKPISDFFKESIKTGVSQHWIVVSGHIADDLKILCEWNNFNYIKIQ